jgi:hypothetical protein
VENYREKVKDNVDVVLGFRQNIIRSEWFDEECKGKLQDRNNARIKMLQRKTRSSVEEYKERRRTTNRMCKNKKRKWENEKLLRMQADVEEHQSRKCYKEVKKVRAGFQLRLNFCKDKEGNLITSKGKIMDRWAEHFSELLNKGTLVEGEGEENESIEILKKKSYPHQHS